MVPQYSPLYATRQHRPQSGVLRVVGWSPVTNQPYLIPLKTKASQQTRAQTRGNAVEWEPGYGVLVYHDTRREADAELDRMTHEEWKVVKEAESLLRAA